MSTPNLTAFAKRLRASADALAALVDDVGDDEARWKYAPDKWSINEIFGHLVDEEQLDVRKRLELLLGDPAQRWPPIDPEGWVREKQFNARTLAHLTVEFLAERQRSIEWLETLRSAGWSNTYAHLTAGPLSASVLLHAWAAHDLLHIRQILRVRYRHLAASAAPGSLDYAGAW
jgi:hypothetical protein